MDRLTQSYLDALAVARKAARIAGENIIALQTRNIDFDEKQSKIDLVTHADITSDKILGEILSKELPGHDITSEESTHTLEGAEYKWVIDPIDGTTNFYKGMQYFSISLALFHKGQPVAGVVYAPALDELFWACTGCGAFLEKPGREPVRLAASRQKTIDGSLLITGFYYDRGVHMRRTLAEIEQFFSLGIMGIRRLGSAALDLCQLAAGRADGFWEFELSPWDYSAAAVIASEAGIRMSTKDGIDLDWQKTSVLGAPEGLWDEMVEFFKQTAD